MYSGNGINIFITMLNGEIMLKVVEWETNYEIILRNLSIIVLIMAVIREEGEINQKDINHIVEWWEYGNKASPPLILDFISMDERGAIRFDSYTT